MPASAAVAHNTAFPRRLGLNWPDQAWEWQILDPEADEILLGLMARDGSATHAGWEEREWIRERKRNPVPWLVFLDDKRRERDARLAKEAEREAKEAERKARQAEWRAEQRRKNAEWQAQHKREQENWYAAFHQRLRDEWIDKLRTVGEHFAAVPRYRHMIPWVEHDIALIRDHPPGPLTWRFHQPTFDATWGERMIEADEAEDRGQT